MLKNKQDCPNLASFKLQNLRIGLRYFRFLKACGSRRHILKLSWFHNSCQQNLCVPKCPKTVLFFQFHIPGTVGNPLHTNRNKRSKSLATTYKEIALLQYYFLELCYETSVSCRKCSCLSFFLLTLICFNKKVHDFLRRSMHYWGLTSCCTFLKIVPFDSSWIEQLLIDKS